MRKIITVCMCAVMLLGLSACGGSKKLTDNKEIYEVLKEKGYTFEIYKGMLMVKGSYDMYVTQGEEYNSIIISKDDTNKIVGLETNGKKFYTAKSGKCSIDLETDEKKDCTDVTEVDAKNVKEQIEKDFSELDIDYMGLLSFGKWYLDENS